MRPAFAALIVLAAAGLLAAGPASAADSPVTTAPAATAPDVAAQIDEYLRTSPTIALPRDAAPGVTPGQAEPRQVHGEVSVAVGNHGYRSAYARSDFPVGKTGTVSIAVAQSQGRFGYGDDRRHGGPGYRYGGRDGGRSLGMAFNFDNSDSADHCRVRADDGRGRIELSRPGERACGPDDILAR